MNHIGVSAEPHPDRQGEYNPVDIRIDWASLIDLVKRVETPFAAQEGAPDLAGKYGLLSTRTAFYPSRYFLGETRPLLRYGEKTVLLLCDCGCEGCWDFVCKITVARQTVTWSEFEQIHRNWDYSALGIFVFDRTQYENEFRFPVGIT